MKNQPFIEACRNFRFRNTPETLRYFYHPDHIGSTSWVTDSAKNGIQYCEYLPFGEPFLDQRSTTWNSRYTFSGKERDNETGYSYFGARYYNSDISIWLSVDPMADQRSWVSPYNYCQNNPIILIDPNGMLDSEHTDGLGNIIAHYDDGDNSVYQHKTGTTKEQIDQQRSQNKNTGGNGVKIGELGKNIDMFTIFPNKLAQSSKKASSMNIFDYFVAVKTGGDWDLKNNISTIWGVAWQFDEKSNDKDVKTTFSCSNFSGANAADVGNFHAGYTGVMARIPVRLLFSCAGAAETYKSFSEGRTMQGVGRMLSLFNPFSNTKGDNVRDHKFNQWGMRAAFDKILKK